MKEKGLIYINYDGKAKPMNYIVRDGGVYTLTMGSSSKVAYIKENETVNAKLDSPKDIDTAVSVKVFEDKKFVETLFNDMNELNNNHFKTLNDNFVALEFDGAVL